MKKGGKIAITLGALAGAGVLAYYLFFKQNSKIYMLEKEEDADDGGGADTNNTNNSGGGDSGFNVPSPFTSSLETKAFQNYVLEVIKDMTILGSNGADGLWGTNTNNAWVKYSDQYVEHQNSQLLDAVDVSPETNAYSKFILRVYQQGLKYKKNQYGNVVLRLHSEQNNMKNYYYQIVYGKNNEWALAMKKYWDGDFKVIASGTYNLTGLTAGSRLKVTKIYDDSGDLYLGYHPTSAQGNIIYPVRKLIQKYWKDSGMDYNDAKTLKTYYW